MRISFFVIISLFIISSSFSQNNEGRNHLIIGMDFGFNGFEDNDAYNANVNAGYEINIRKLPFLTIDPYIGGGFIQKKVRTSIDEILISKYDIKYYTFGIAPKLQLSNPDKDFYIFLENELSFMNAFAKIEDKHTDRIRKNNQYFNFYYSPKVGFILAQNKIKWGFWGGLSTLSLNNLLNNKLPSAQRTYSGEGIIYRCGFKVYF